MLGDPAGGEKRIDAGEKNLRPGASIKCLRKGGNMTDILNHEEFIRLAVVRLRNANFKGIHSVYSGFNEAFKKYFEGADPVKVTTEFAGAGRLVIRPVKNGVMLYLPEDAPPGDRAERALRKMGLIE
jgi:hypothetical protein